MADVELILITWNSSRYLDRCLEGIRRQTVAPTLIAVDNASEDETLSILQNASPSVLIRNERNEGYARAANQGFAAGAAPFVCVLNPDVYLEPDYLEKVIDAMRKIGPSCGSAAGKLLRGSGSRIEPTGVVDSLGIRMTRSNRHFDIGAGEPEPGWTEPREVFGVTGAAIVLRRALLNDVAIDGEVFDTDFFTYREDADLAWRARMFGWRSFCVPAAVGTHVRTVTPERRGELSPIVNYHGVKNRFLLRLKNPGARLLLRTLPWTLARDLVVVAATMTVEMSSFRAWGWLIRHLPDVWRKRRMIQERRTVGDVEIARWFS